MKRITAAAMLIGVCGVIANSGTAGAQEAVAAAGEDDAAVRAYWTPERLANAIPMERHPASTRADGTPFSAGALSPVTDGAPRALSPAGLPTDLEDWTQQLYPAQDLSVTQLPEGVKPNTISSFGYPYTETRVFANGSEVKNYPYSASGHLFFVIQRSGGIDKPGNYNCSASVISHRIVVTAGHCTGSPFTNGHGFFWYSKWMFVPADTNGTAPFGTWTVNVYGAGAGWRTGNGSVPNSEDWGFLVMNDQKGVKIGDKTGWFGFETNSLDGNNVTTLGYPNNLDKGELMQQNQAQVDDSGGSNTYLIGSAGGGGASGGPWVESFGQTPSCSGKGCPTGQFQTLGGNWIVGVTSYGPTGTTGYLGASQFDSNFLSQYQSLCKLKSGNC